MSEISRRVAARYIEVTAGVPLDDKMKALLLKLRKGADSTLSLPQLFKVLALLGGWRVEEIVGAVPLHYTSIYNGKPSEMLRRLDTEDESAARAEYAKLESLQVASLPASPKPGHLYVMGLQPFATMEREYAKGRKFHGATYRMWVGAPGFRVTDPHGKVFEILPDHHDVDSGSSLGEQDKGVPKIDLKRLKKSLRTYDVLPWLKRETSYIAQINEALGLEEHVPADQRTRENTGTCGVCFRNIKLVVRGSEKLMALHGYNRPGYGYVVGRCFGGDHQPYELSSKATEGMLATAEAHVKSAATYVAKLKSPGLTEFNANLFSLGLPEKKIEKSLNPDAWAYELGRHVDMAEYNLTKQTIERDIYKWLVDHWEVRELPHEGDKKPVWWDEAVKAVRRGR